MPTEMYGEKSELEPKAEAGRKKKALKEAPKKRKPKVEGFHLRIGVMGSHMEIVSPIPRDQFVEEMVIAVAAVAIRRGFPLSFRRLIMRHPRVWVEHCQCV